MKKTGLIHKFFRKKEKRLYAVSDQIGCMSPGNIAYVRKHNPSVSEKKLHLLPNWANMLPLASEAQIQELKEREGFQNKFIILFGGNIGLPQKLENIVNLAEACEDQEDFLFLIIGNGSERENLAHLIASKKFKQFRVESVHS